MAGLGLRAGRLRGRGFARLAAGGWRLAAGGWRLAAGGWRLRTVAEEPGLHAAAGFVR
ncbi:hypothetical protein QD712_19015 [Streptomyces acidiscabies]|uniref:hypothetical protein n=1 Tax=Streptomyces acidiscabies TaxID=42234 RepID=UPI0030D52592